MRIYRVSILSVLVLLLVSACSQPEQEKGRKTAELTSPVPKPQSDKMPQNLKIEATKELENFQETRTPTIEAFLEPTKPVANVISAQISGSPGAYQFAVEVSSPDEGCSRYTDWWEVISEDGELLYRRILLHSHTNEQPFTRSGGPVPVSAGQVVIIRAHFHSVGYSGTALKGSVQEGFEPIRLAPDFFIGLEEVSPLPENCAF